MAEHQELTYVGLGLSALVVFSGEVEHLDYFVASLKVQTLGDMWLRILDSDITSKPEFVRSSFTKWYQM